MNDKLKALKKQYYQYLDQNGNDGKTWYYFSLCESIWGPSQSANPVASVDEGKDRHQQVNGGMPLQWLDLLGH